MLYSLTRPASLAALVALITGCASGPLTLPTEWHPYQAAPLLAPGPPDRLSQSHPLEARAGYLVDHHYPARVSNSRVRFLVLHFTSDDNAAAFHALQGPNVSVHYLVTRSPERRGDTPVVLQMVPESRRAWHAGVSAWQGRTHLNDSSIGIEIVNEGPREGTLNGWAPYSADQINAVIALARDITRRYGLDPTAIVGHSDIAPTRKVDPGPAFPWHRLYRAGIGAWPRTEDVDRFRTRFEREPPSLEQFLVALSAYGYDVSPADQLTDQARAAIRAFQMHFRPADYSGEPDTQTAAILWALLERYRPEALPH